MAIVLSDLASYVGVDLDHLTDGDLTSETQRVTLALNMAVVLVDDVLSSAFRPVPATVRDRLVLEVGHAVYKRQDSPSGSSQGVEYNTGQPVLGPKDPLTQVWPILRRYVAPFGRSVSAPAGSNDNFVSTFEEALT